MIMHGDSNISFNSGSSWNNIRVFDNYAPNIEFFWNRYILIAELIEIINFVEVETIT